MVTVVSAVLMVRYAPRYGRSHLLIYVLICSLVGSLSVVSCKALGIALKLTLRGSNQIFKPPTLAFLCTVLICIVIQMNYLNKALDTFNIPHSTWHELAMDRPAWRDAIHGALLDGGRPTRVCAAVTNRRIDASVADGRAGIWDIGASAAHLHARAAIAAPLPPRPPPPPRAAARRRATRRPAFLLWQPPAADAPLPAAQQ